MERRLSDEIILSLLLHFLPFVVLLGFSNKKKQALLPPSRHLSD